MRSVLFGSKRWQVLASSLALAGLLLCSGPARGQGLPSLAVQLGSSERKQMTDAIAALAASEEPGALAILQALEGDRLGLGASGEVLEKKSGQWVELAS